MRPPSSLSLHWVCVCYIAIFSFVSLENPPFFETKSGGIPFHICFISRSPDILPATPSFSTHPTQPSLTSFCYVCAVWPPECDRFKLPFDFFLANKKGKNYLSGSSQPFKLFIHFSGLIPRFILLKNKQLLSIAYPSNQLPSSHTCVTAPNLKKKRNRNKKGS